MYLIDYLKLSWTLGLFVFCVFSFGLWKMGVVGLFHVLQGFCVCNVMGKRVGYWGFGLYLVSPVCLLSVLHFPTHLPCISFVSHTFSLCFSQLDGQLFSFLPHSYLLNSSAVSPPEPHLLDSSVIF